MLAPNYKSAAELGLTEDQKSALISTMHGLQRGEFSDFNMSSWCKCILGQANVVAAEAHMHQLMAPCPATALFIPNLAEYCIKHRSNRTYETISQEEAAWAVRNFLVTGDPRWDEALEIAHVVQRAPKVDTPVLETV